jgi:filamentous hemagglutinin
MSVAIVEDVSGTRSVLIGTSEPGGYLRPGVQLRPGESLIPGLGHAEEDIINYAKANNLKVIEIGATRPVCPTCVRTITLSGARITTPIKTP